MTMELEYVTGKAGAETHLEDVPLGFGQGGNAPLGRTLAGKTTLLRPLARRRTAHASANDRVLWFSREVHGYPRPGESGESLTLFHDEGDDRRVGAGTAAFSGTPQPSLQPGGERRPGTAAPCREARRTASGP